MSTTPARRVVRPGLATATVCLAAAALLPTAPAQAAEPRPTGTRTPVTAPYAVPLDALGGLSLGQHLADLRLADPRLG